jgi:hypothetical protein
MGIPVFTDTTGWQAALKSLQNFLLAHPEIHIDEHRIVLPNEVKQSFYAAFDSTRRSFVKDYCLTLPERVTMLSQFFRQTEHTLCTQTQVEAIVLPHSLRTFVDDPATALSDCLYDILMSLLQKKLSIRRFEREAQELLDTTTSILYRSGYEFLVFYRILESLGPREAWRVEFDEALMPKRTATTSIEPGYQQAFAQRRVPEMVLGTRDGSWFSVKTESAPEIGYYDMPIARRRDNTLAGDSQAIVGHRVMMVHRLADPDNIPTIADRDKKRVVSPSIVVEVSSAEELSIKACRLALGNRALTLQPEQGYYVLLPASASIAGWFDKDESQVQQLPSLCFINLDFELERLDPIIEALCRSKPYQFEVAPISPDKSG